MFNKILDIHVKLFYADESAFEDITENILIDFGPTIEYCLTQGNLNFTNLNFTKYCKENFHFTDREYLSSLTYQYLMHGLYEDDLIIDEVLLYTRLHSISTTSLDKLKKFKALESLVTYLCVYKNLPDKNFTKIDKYTRTLIKVKNKQAWFDCDDGEIDLSFGLISPKRKYCKSKLDLEIFYRPINFKNLIKIYGKVETTNLAEASRIYNLEKTLMLEDYPNINNRNDTIMKAMENLINKTNINESCTKICLAAPSESLDVIKHFKPFLLFTNEPFNSQFLEEYEEINKVYKWVFIYSRIMTNQYVSIKLLENEEYIEENVYNAIQENQTLLLSRVKKPTKKLIDFENQRYLGI